MFAKILRFKYMGKIMVEEDDDNVLPRETEPPFL